MQTNFFPDKNYINGNSEVGKLLRMALTVKRNTSKQL